MRNFVVLAADGKTIWQRGYCAEDELELQPIPAGGQLLILNDGVPLPDGDQELDPKTETFRPALPQVKRRLGEAIASKVAEHIQSGFSSSAKGQPLIYDGSQEGQLGMLLSAIGGGMIMAKANANGIFAPVAHTQIQARQVVADFIAKRDAALQKAATIAVTIRAASDVQQLKDIEWTPPA